jgi:hypothetical protein
MDIRKSVESMKTKQLIDRKTSYQQAQVKKLEFVITTEYL